MSDWKKSLFPSLTALVAIGAFVTGNEFRTRQDMGRKAVSTRPTDLASLEFPLDPPREVPEGEYFYGLLLLLEREYLEPVKDERKLAIGAVKGMINGLWDPMSQYLAADHWVQNERQLKGEYSGLGVEVRLSYPPDQLTKVRKDPRSADATLLFAEATIAMVVPGGPADKTGLKVGDRVVRVNGKWLVGWSDIKSVRDAQDAAAKGQLSPDAFKKLRAGFQRRAEDSMSVGRALDYLTTGEGKSFEVEWESAGVKRSAQVVSASSTLPDFTVAPDGTLSLRLFSGVSKRLSVPDGEGPLVVDLRHSGLGDSREIEPVLSALAPAATWGQIVKDGGGVTRTVRTTKGLSTHRPLKVLVDRSTRGAAEILALALKAKGGATLVGGPMAGESVWLEPRKLEDGSGYFLNTGRFVPESLEARK